MKMVLPELRICLLHLTKQAIVPRLKADRHHPHLKIQHDLVGGRLLVKVPGSSQGRVAGEREFLCHGKDSNFVTLALLGVAVTGKDECGLREIGLPGKSLHFFIAETTSVRNYGQLVALKRAIGKYVELHDLECPLGHGNNSPANLPP